MLELVSVMLEESIRAFSKVVPRNQRRYMVREMPVNVQGEELDPRRIVHMDRGEEASVQSCPICVLLPSNSSGMFVMEISECAQPELKHHKGDHVQLEHTAVGGNEGDGDEGSNVGKDDTANNSNSVL